MIGDIWTYSISLIFVIIYFLGNFIGYKRFRFNEMIRFSEIDYIVMKDGRVMRNGKR